MALSGAEYLIAVTAAFPLFFVVLVLFLFGGMTQGVIIRTESLPLSSAIVMAKEGPFLDRALGPTRTLTWASQFYTPTIAPQNPALRLLGQRGGFW